MEGWINHGEFQQPGKGRDVMRCDCAVTTGESLVQGSGQVVAGRQVGLASIAQTFVRLTGDI